MVFLLPKSLPWLSTCLGVTSRTFTMVSKACVISPLTVRTLVTLEPQGACLLAKHFHVRDFVLVEPLPKMPFPPVILLAQFLTSFKPLLKPILLSEADLYPLFNISATPPQHSRFSFMLFYFYFFSFSHSVQNLYLFAMFIFFPLEMPTPHGQGDLYLSCSLLYAKPIAVTGPQ